MHTEKSIQQSAAQIVLRIARNLHRSANAELLAVSLPVLRRLLATTTLTNISLPELHRQRDKVQRKHVLRMLSVEAGFKCWEDYRSTLKDMSADQLSHFDLLRRCAGYPNLWFSNYEEAQQYTSKHNGRVFRIGTQAVVLVE